MAKRWRRRRWGVSTPSKIAVLHGRYGVVVAEVQREFFALQSWQREALFREYAAAYGDAASEYARRTFTAWKSGDVRPSGASVERLLDLVPKYLPPERRFELVKLVRQRYMKRGRETLRCTLQDWQPALTSAVQRMLQHSQVAIPPAVVDGARWLAGDDAAAAREMLRRAEVLEAEQRAQYLSVEFRRIAAMLAALPATAEKSATHTLTLPQGDILVQIHIPEVQRSLGSRLFGGLMTKGKPDSTSLTSIASSLPTPVQRPNLVESVDLTGLSPAEVQALRSKVLEARVELDRERSAADDRFVDSTRDMARDVKAVEALERTTRGDYTVDGQYRTASGETRVRVTKSTNTTIIVVCVVVGILLLIVLLKQ